MYWTHRPTDRARSQLVLTVALPKSEGSSIYMISWRPGGGWKEEITGERELGRRESSIDGDIISDELPPPLATYVHY